MLLITGLNKKVGKLVSTPESQETACSYRFQSSTRPLQLYTASVLPAIAEKGDNITEEPNCCRLFDITERVKL